MREEAVLFGKTRSFVGVVTIPQQDGKESNHTAIILLNAGLVHHVGPNRLYVNLARKLAAKGFVVFRFDYSGIGDSRSREDNLPYSESRLDETREALDFLNETRGSKRFVLMGICSGAIDAFTSSREDPRVTGIGLISTYCSSARTLPCSTRRWSCTRRISQPAGRSAFLNSRRRSPGWTN